MRCADGHRKTRRRGRGPSVALVIALGAGCHMAPPAPKIPGWVDPAAQTTVVGDEEREMWAQSSQALAELEAQGFIVSDPKASAYLAGILTRLLPGSLPASAPTPGVRIVRSVDRQASSLANGVILVSTSYLAALANEAQLAGLLGHELGHFLARDSLVQKRYAQLSTSTVERMRLARSLEEAADRTGLALMRHAGYDPREMAGMLAVVQADDMAGRGPVSAWESHPYIPDRLNTLRRSVGAVAASETTINREPYEDAMADLFLVAAQGELDARRLARARAAIERHLLIRPASGHGYFLLAEHARLTEPDGRRSAIARRNYERAVELAPNDPDAVRALALLYREDGDLERARPLFATYLRVAPQAPDRKLIERYLAGAPGPAAGSP
jgi:tetratricopeptide (TPR) repeat protein